MTSQEVSMTTMVLIDNKHLTCDAKVYIQWYTPGKNCLTSRAFFSKSKNLHKTRFLLDAFTSVSLLNCDNVLIFLPHNQVPLRLSTLYSLAPHWRLVTCSRDSWLSSLTHQRVLFVLPYIVSGVVCHWAWRLQPPTLPWWLDGSHIHTYMCRYFWGK